MMSTLTQAGENEKVPNAEVITFEHGDEFTSVLTSIAPMHANDTVYTVSESSEGILLTNKGLIEKNRDIIGVTTTRREAGRIGAPSAEEDPATPTSFILARTVKDQDTSDLRHIFTLGNDHLHSPRIHLVNREGQNGVVEAQFSFHNIDPRIYSFFGTILLDSRNNSEIIGRLLRVQLKLEKRDQVLTFFHNALNPERAPISLVYKIHMLNWSEEEITKLLGVPSYEPIDLNQYARMLIADGDTRRCGLPLPQLHGDIVEG